MFKFLNLFKAIGRVGDSVERVAKDVDTLAKRAECLVGKHDKCANACFAAAEQHTIEAEKASEIAYLLRNQ